MSRKVQCGTHGPSTGYGICRHIVDHHAPVVHVSEPDPNAVGLDQTIGSIVCAIPARDHTSADLMIVCRACAEQHGWNKVVS